MASVYNFNMHEILAFALVLFRIIGFIVSMPIFGTTSVSTHAKVLLSLSIAFVVFPNVGWQKMTTDIESMAIITLVIKELFIGLCFGFLARLFFMAVTMAGQIISVSMGLASAQLFNPTIGETTTALDQFYVIISSIFFLTINGHHILISGIVQTFDIIPITKMTISFTSFQEFGILVQRIMSIALKMGAPILVSILFMNFAVAVVGRAVPQINILITSMPINVLTGFAIIIITLPLLIWQMSDLVNETSLELFRFIKAF